jgi:hypothetical protein
MTARNDDTKPGSVTFLSVPARPATGEALLPLSRGDLSIV